MDLTSVPEELREFVEQQIASGRSLDELLCEGLRLLEFNEEVFAENRDDFVRAMEEGVAAAERGDLHDGPRAVADAIRSAKERISRE